MPTRSGTHFLLLAVISLATSALSRAEPVTLSPHLELRADHMVLDAARFGAEIIVGTQSGIVTRFDWREGRVLDDVLRLTPREGQDLPPAARSVAISPAGRILAVTSSDERLHLFERAASAAPFSPLAQRPLMAGMRCLFLDEERLLVGTMRGEIILHRVEDGLEVYRHQLEYDPVYAMALHPGGRFVAVSFRSSRIQIIDVESGKTVRKLDGHRDSVFALAWFGDGRLVSASKDRHVYLWDTDDPHGSPKPHTLYTSEYYISAIAVDEATGRLAFILNDESLLGVVQLPGGELRYELEGHTAPVQAMFFVAGGRVLLSTGGDSRILVWKLPPT